MQAGVALLLVTLFRPTHGWMIPTIPGDSDYPNTKGSRVGTYLHFS